MTSETLKAAEAEAAAVQHPGTERVTLADLEAQIVAEEYIHPSFAPHMTVGMFKLRNGYVLVGKSAPADPKNFDEGYGRKLVRDDAIRQLWPIMGYMLREKKHLAEI
ncbi:MAG TPA: Gp49 family protein [Steroidobacteraceae bacterium]|nr:Gp49 family protein [Steroidobacteraceae bacterium]